MTFESFDLHPDLMAGVRDMGYRDPTPIQAQAIPAALEGKDVIGIAQTGTGKTAAFLIPILHRLMSGPSHTTRALILAPTRELALQIDEVRIGLTYHTSLSGCCVYGGANMNNQTRALKGGPDVVTATPGRLLDHLWHGLPKFDQVEVLVLDEADRMLDMGFLPDLEKILRRLPEKRQNLLFSATMPKEIERLAREMMVDPISVTVGPKARPVDLIDQQLHVLAPAAKVSHLIRLVGRPEFESVLVFTRTKTGANQVFNDLRKARVPVAVIHGDRAQEERIRSLEAFRHGQIRVLVATDVAARGIDVEGISHVINYDVPRSPDDYVHRIGRTGRAGESGHAITFVTREEERDVRNIERQINMSLPRHEGGRAPERPVGRSRPDDDRRGDRGRGRPDDERSADRRPARRDDRSERWDREPRRGREDREDRERRPDRRPARSDDRRPERDDDRPSRRDERRPTRSEDRRPERDDDRPSRRDDRRPARSEDRRPERDDRRPARSEDRRPERDDDRPSRRDDRRPARSEDRRPERDDDRPSRRDDRRPARSEDRRPERGEDRPSRRDDRRPARSDDRPARRDDRRTERSEERPARRDDRAPAPEKRPRREDGERNDPSPPKRTVKKPSAPRGGKADSPKSGPPGSTRPKKGTKRPETGSAKEAPDDVRAGRRKRRSSD